MVKKFLFRGAEMFFFLPSSKSPSEFDGQADSELSSGLRLPVGVVPSAAELAASGALDALFEQIDAGKLNRM